MEDAWRQGRKDTDALATACRPGRKSSKDRHRLPVSGYSLSMACVLTPYPPMANQVIRTLKPHR
ncbi:hypothetical protein PA598K_03617 [Paenibacillus sp. 598K]|uniref:hypothetical protein n=1 Tax=Paenibacillus sp. 598K TaxID=1117987 RepID=UPI000FF93393|nr:hypothetical protein [Paenibacillus sp. 598K]GBF75227.1 hypothetical protein PA598K_03617 [Paenibacillus sp. 598K]